MKKVKVSVYHVKNTTIVGGMLSLNIVYKMEITFGYRFVFILSARFNTNLCDDRSRHGKSYTAKKTLGVVD